MRDRFARDPLGINRPPDGTATEDYAPTPGGQYRHKSHEIFVRPDVPLGFLVRHSGTGGPRKIRHAQFKLAVMSDVA